MRETVTATARHVAVFALAVALLGGCASDDGSDGSDVAVVDLETEAALTPLAVDASRPRFSWRLRGARRGIEQTRARILVASSPERLSAAAADVWDSGAVDTTSPFLDWDGPALSPRTRYYWTVRVWDEANAPTAWAEPTWFETGMGDDPWPGVWIAGPARPDTNGLAGLVDPAAVAATGDFCRPIGTPGILSLAAAPFADAYRANAPNSCRGVRPAPLLRRAFAVDGEVATARLYVSGLAYAETWINGERLAPQTALEAGFTDYTHTVLYTTHDVTALLRPGENAIAVELGSGFYDYDVVGEWSWDGADWRGEPRLRAALYVRYADGGEEIIATNPSWRSAGGPTRWDNINVGETYDARFAQPGWAAPGFDDSAWRPARPVAAPAGRLVAEAHEPITIVAHRQPVAVAQPRPGVTVYDVGEQISGWAELTLAAARGDAAEITYGEYLAADGTVEVGLNLHIADRIQTDFYVAAGSGEETWHPRFSYKGFRYVQIAGPRQTAFTGEIRNINIQVVRSGVRATGDFSCDHPLLNAIYANLRRAVANNLHGIVTDTPIYEKNGWLGDAQLTAPTTSLLFDMQRFYRKWLRDIRDSQRTDGEISDIVPSGELYGYAGVGWSPIWGPTPVGDAALFLIPWEVLSRYGDDRPLRESYTAMARYLDVLVPAYSVDDILSSELGDHLNPVGADLPRLASTAYVAEFARRLADTAALLGDSDGERHWRARRGAIGDAFNAAFFDATTGTYREEHGDDFVQTANLLPLAFDLVPEGRRDDVARAIATDIAAHGGNLQTGVIGTRHILVELTRAGLFDTAFGVATQTDFPSWGQWIELGYTALAENWGPALRSRDHHFTASIGQWLIEDLAGLRASAPGFAEIDFDPHVPGAGVDTAQARLDSVRGEIEVCWRRLATGFLLEVTVPPTATAIVHVPSRDAAAVREDGGGRVVAAAASPGVERIGEKDGDFLYRVASGRYRFLTGSVDPAAVCGGADTTAAP